jgi:hypothetical protein
MENNGKNNAQNNRNRELAFRFAKPRDRRGRRSTAGEAGGRLPHLEITDLSVNGFVLPFCLSPIPKPAPPLINPRRHDARASVRRGVRQSAPEQSYNLRPGLASSSPPPAELATRVSSIPAIRGRSNGSSRCGVSFPSAPRAPSGRANAGHRAREARSCRL